MAKLSCFWIEGSRSESWIWARSYERAKELFIEQFGEQKIRYIGKDED